MKKWNINFSRILWEIPAVVLAVFLALGVNNCNESRKEKAAASLALRAILLEVQDNEESIRDNLEANQNRQASMIPVRDSLVRLGQDSLKGGVSIGYDQTILSNAAWEMAKLTGATRQFEPRLIQNLSRMYYMQEMYMNLGNGFFDQLSSPAFHASDNEKARLDACLNLIKIADSIGQALMEAYASILEEYGGELE